MEITRDTTYGEVAALPEFAGFARHIMVCRPATWELLLRAPISMTLCEGQEYQIGRIVRGLAHIKRLVDEGHQVAYDIWDEAACAEDPTRRDVKLFFMPGKPGAPFMLLLSGGAYLSVCNNTEGFATAPELVDAGYNVFVLSYRVRLQPLMPKPLDDVAQALRFVLERADELGVGRSYGVMGFSAGGHLAASWGREDCGYAAYGLPAPAVLALCYAVLDFEVLGPGSDPRMVDMVCGGASPAGVGAYSIPCHVGDGYPPVFFWQCLDDDIVVPGNAERLCRELERCGIAHQSRVYARGGHALAKPHDHEADLWLEDALPFMREQLGSA